MITEPKPQRPAPRNILESIFYGVDVVNQNVVTLSENLEDLQNRVLEMQGQVRAIMQFFNQPTPEPDVPGAGEDEESK